MTDEKRPRVSALGTVELQFTNVAPTAPHLQFEPEHILVPIEVALGVLEDGSNPELSEWLIERQRKADPGPVHFENGRAWTDASEAEERNG